MEDICKETTAHILADKGVCKSFGLPLTVKPLTRNTCTSSDGLITLHYCTFMVEGTETMGIASASATHNGVTEIEIHIDDNTVKVPLNGNVKADFEASRAVQKEEATPSSEEEQDDDRSTEEEQGDIEPVKEEQADFEPTEEVQDDAEPTEEEHVDAQEPTTEEHDVFDYTEREHGEIEETADEHEDVEYTIEEAEERPYEHANVPNNKGKEAVESDDDDDDSIWDDDEVTKEDDVTSLEAMTGDINLSTDPRHRVALTSASA